MDTRLFAYIIAAAEEQDIDRAAERLKMTPTALEGHIHSMESELGAELFCRSGCHLQLTSIGSVFLKTAYKMLELERKLMTHVAISRAKAEIEAEKKAGKA